MAMTPTEPAVQAPCAKARFPPPTHRSALSLRISASTATNFDDMFDFEDSKSCRAASFDVDDSAQLVLRDGEVSAVDASDAFLPQEATPLLQIVRKGDNFWVKPAHARRLWRVVHKLAGGDQSLCEGDVLKLGRVKFRVHQLAASGEGAALKVPSRDEAAPSPEDITADAPADDVCCRICLDHQGEDECDPLVRACKCSGSVAFVHRGCLRKWIGTRLGLFEQAPSFVYRQTSCELCKAPYPLSIGDQPLVELPPIASPFVALDINDRRHSALHFLSLNGEQPQGIGRTNSCAVRIYEASISRCHATIRCSQDGEFVLADNNSKFGTLLAVRKPVLLEAGVLASFQVGSTVLTLSLSAYD
eukprot:TRINITY_DN35734_c0_g1_i1.p1 TRINITY_DN35734_c0_g1~~TRINITY_DN35734_c0_g1_i1.p1  ORF type:complete len:387 (-),score=59.29 TRINITY_DN35734_c0_g1_i1:323-1402(-)